MNSQNTTDAIALAQADPAVAELEATRGVYDMLKPLSCEARTRVLSHVSGLLDVTGVVRPASKQGQSSGAQEEADLQREQKAAPKFSTFAELFSAADPKTHAQNALVAGYWLQVCQGAETFDGFSTNKELKQLSHGLGNITVAINALKNEKPALALQVTKSGRSRQARKTYKLTAAGIRSVEDMING
jgi:hypothetical protein